MSLMNEIIKSVVIGICSSFTFIGIVWGIHLGLLYDHNRKFKNEIDNYVAEVKESHVNFIAANYPHP